MNKYLIATLLVISLSLAGCITQQKIPPAERVGDDLEKITRFDYMQNRWSSINNTWITGKMVTPYVLMKLFNIPREQATVEISEFKSIQNNFSWFSRFFSYINLNGIRFYINPPE